MSTAAPHAPAALLGAPRPGWRRSALGAALGVVTGGLASAAVVGLAVLAAWRLGGDPVPDAIGNALSPLGWFALVPVAAAVAADAACRREAFWLVTRRRPTWGAGVAAALLAPAAAAGIGWRGGVIAWVLGASTVLLRCCAPAEPAAPRLLAALAVRRSRALIAAAAIGAALVGLAGLMALQLGSPALRAAAAAPAGSAAVPASQRVELTGRSLAGVTVLGLDGPLAGVVRIGAATPAPFTLAGGEGRTIELVPAPSCRNGEAGFSAIDVRYRTLGVERVSSLDLGREVRIRC